MRLPAIIILFFLSHSLSAQRRMQLKSPDKKIVFIFSATNQEMRYEATYLGRTVIAPSLMRIAYDKGRQLENRIIHAPIFSDSTENYSLPTGKASHIISHYNQIKITVEETKAPFSKINIVVRAFNDGLAFRYEFLSSQNDSLLISDEQTEFNIPGDPVVRSLLLPNYTSSHEGLYTTNTFSKFPQDTLMDMPTLFEFPGEIFLAITEANLLDYAGMYLMKKGNKLRSMLSPSRTDPFIKVKAKYPHKSPWRVLMISNRIGTLLESNILTTLSEPCRISDMSWIKPGKTTFPWWNGNVLPDTINAPGNNFVTQQYYIDFCARNNIQYHSVVEYGLHQWYVDDGVGFQPGPHSDVTRAVPGLDMKEICDYAKSRGVGVRVWVHWAALYPKLDSAFAIFEQWGLSGMMIDFMDRDDQEMVNIQTEMLEKAAKHHLHIQFHGAYKPTGLNRTYPNEFTREGTLNYEVNKWGPGLPPDHDINIVFTRMLAGSTDYHLGGFRAVPDTLYRAQYTRPLMLGTRCHMLAMYVVIENALGMLCDYPAAYEGEDGFDFLKKVPTTWDETKVLAAKPGEYVAIARRKNNDWYIGSINNSTARTITIPLSFLANRKYRATVYSDAENVIQNPNAISQTSVAEFPDASIRIKLAAGGGAVLTFISE